MTQRNTNLPRYDYVNKAWTRGGRYVGCDKAFALHCDCYGCKHRNEPVPVAVWSMPDNEQRKALRPKLDFVNCRGE